MQAQFTEEATADTVRVSPPRAPTKAQKRIAKLEERQQKLNAARAKATKELADEERKEIVASGQAEFLAALEALDLTTREMVVSNVLQATGDLSRRNKIQAWIAVIPDQIPRKNGTATKHEPDDAERNSTSADNKTDDASSDSASPPNADPQPIT